MHWGTAGAPETLGATPTILVLTPTDSGEILAAMITAGTQVQRHKVRELQLEEPAWIPI